LLFFFIIISVAVSCILFLVSFIFSSKKKLHAKRTAYECGFDPYGDVKDTFKVQYYVVGILFMLFDVELAYLIP
jgi:NADH:ubiquinone oxidoreductase subunit 3 (subunit A)